jgi:hypothetical protein
MVRGAGVLSVPENGAVLDIALSASGPDKYWVLGSGMAVECRLSSVELLDPVAAPVRLPLKATSLAAAMRTATGIRLSAPAPAGASLAYEGENLDWSVDAAGHVGAAWRNRPDVPYACIAAIFVPAQCFLPRRL